MFEFLIPAVSRTVRIQRRHKGELCGDIHKTHSRPADVRSAILIFAEPLEELRIFGTPRALRRIGADGPRRDIRGVYWLFRVTPTTRPAFSVYCYEDES